MKTLHECEFAQEPSRGRIAAFSVSSHAPDAPPLRSLRKSWPGATARNGWPRRQASNTVADVSEAVHRAVLEMVAFGCPGCAYAIERAGRRVHGVRDVRVRLAEHEIEVTYDGSQEAIGRILEIVRLLGHDAQLRKELAP